MITIEYGSKDSSIVLIQPVDEHDIEVLEREVEEIRNLAAMDFRLVAVKISDWNKDLSPWPAPAVLGKDDFGSGAGETLREILSICQDKSRAYFLGGYSLAALPVATNYEYWDAKIKRITPRSGSPPDSRGKAAPIGEGFFVNQYRDRTKPILSETANGLSAMVASVAVYPFADEL